MLYIGSTENLKRRLKEHNARKVTSTKTRTPLILICYEAYGYKEDALKRENFLKGSDGRKDIKKRMGRYFE